MGRRGGESLALSGLQSNVSEWILALYTANGSEGKGWKSQWNYILFTYYAPFGFHGGMRCEFQIWFLGS